MPPENTLNADCTLTAQGEAAANHISTVLNNQGEGAAVNVARREYNWEPLGTGISRTTFKSQNSRETVEFEAAIGQETKPTYISEPDKCVIKVGIPNSGQMKTEVQQWQLISGERQSDEPWTRLEPLVAPVRDYDPESYRWLTQPLGNTDDATSQQALRVREAAQEKGFFTPDVVNQNIALYDGEPKVIDMGQDFIYTGYTDDERWLGFRKKLTDIGCRDVESRIRLRQFKKWTWRAPRRLPGLPYDTEKSVMEFSRGGELKRMKLHNTVIPQDVTTDDEVVDTLEAALQVESAPDNSTARTLHIQDGGIVPVAEARNPRADGASIVDMELFLTAFYDEYDVKFAAVIPEGYDYTTPGSPPSASESGDILGEIESEFDGM